MTPEVVGQLSDAVQRLPRAVAAQLAGAAREGLTAVGRLKAQVDSPNARHACDLLLDAVEDGTPVEFLAGALTVLAERPPARRTSEVVWTGPGEGRGSRLTIAVVKDLVAMARDELLLVSFATYGTSDLTAALEAAHARGVAITTVLERPQDNAAYSGPTDPFPGLPATRLVWPGSHRPQGAALHAKILVVDRAIALIGSANLTSRAFLDNLECGVLHRDPVVAGAVVEHVDVLRREGVLIAS